MSKLTEIISETFEIDASKITEKDNIVNYENWDSMTHMILITSIEDMFEIELTNDEIVEMKTVSDIKTILAKRKV